MTAGNLWFKPNATIAAIATPPGYGAISVLRVSGPDSFAIADRIFQGKRKPSNCPTHTIHYGKIINPNDRISGLIDEVLLSVFRSPNSYTAEDMIEISCHGGSFVSEKILSLLLKEGARLAEPGEFTKRAVLNGKMTLLQAEAILDLVKAKTDLAHQSAIGQLTGNLTSIIFDLRERIKDVLCAVENFLEFEDTMNDTDYKKIETKIGKTEKIINRLITKGEKEKFLREGVCAVIVGRANVGKSSLFNQLLGANRAIVTEIPGTTRDTLEATIEIEGIPFRLLDTCGIGLPKDQIEVIGMERTDDYLTNSDIILTVFDNSEAVKDEDLQVLSKTKEKPRIIVLNKIDLKSYFNKKILNGGLVIEVSAKYGWGIKELRDTLAKEFKTSNREAYFITNRRHLETLKQASKALARSKNLRLLETQSYELRAALSLLGELTGDVTNEEILDKIFSQFCIGK